MILYVDRIENGCVVCENDRRITLRIPRDRLPKNIREGSMLRFENGNFFRMPEAENDRRRLIEKKFQRLLRKK